MVCVVLGACGVGEEVHGESSWLGSSGLWLGLGDIYLCVADLILTRTIAIINMLYFAQTQTQVQTQVQTLSETQTQT